MFTHKSTKIVELSALTDRYLSTKIGGETYTRPFNILLRWLSRESREGYKLAVSKVRELLDDNDLSELQFLFTDNVTDISFLYHNVLVDVVYDNDLSLIVMTKESEIRLISVDTDYYDKMLSIIQDISKILSSNSIITVKGISTKNTASVNIKIDIGE